MVIQPVFWDERRTNLENMQKYGLPLETCDKCPLASAVDDKEGLHCTVAQAVYKELFNRWFFDINGVLEPDILNGLAEETNIAMSQVPENCQWFDSPSSSVGLFGGHSQKALIEN